MKKFLDIVEEQKPTATLGLIKHSIYWSLNMFRVMADPDEVSVNKIGLPAENRIAIYFIHGTFDQPSGMRDLKTRLQEKLPSDKYVFRIVRFTGRYQGNSIVYFAHQLLNIIQNNGDSRVFIFGHSRGGVVASYFAECIAGHHGIEVPLIVPIGAPFKGSKWVYPFKPFMPQNSSIIQMHPGSDLLAKLLEKIENSIKEKSRTYRFYSAENDWLVSTDSACPEISGVDRVEFMETLKRHGHLSIMSSWVLVASCAELLEQISDLTNSIDFSVSKLPSPNNF